MRPPTTTVIFDVDGVLVKSMERNHKAYESVFRSLGVRIPRRDVFAEEGRRSRELIELLAKARGLNLSADTLDEMTRRHQEAFAAFGRMPMYPGAVRLLRDLHRRGLRIALVTGNWRVNVETQFGEIVSLFEVIVTAEDVKRTKPDPEPYRKALEMLAVAPERAVVVENAPLGVRAAKAAGLRVIAITTTNPPDVLHEADVIVSRVGDVAYAIDSLDRR